MGYLKGLKVQVKEENKVIQGFQNTPMKIHRCRPQFKPDGALLTVKRGSNKIEIKEIPTVQGSDNKEQRQVYSGLTDILMRYTKINDGKVLSIDLRDQMDNMKLNKQDAQRIDQLMDPKLRGLHQSVSKTYENYEDIYIQDSLSNARLPFVIFKKDPKELFFFFESLAQLFVQELNRKKKQVS